MRSNGRKLSQLRPLKITSGYIKTADGSVLIEMGDTKVICTAKFEERAPQFLRNSGKGWITAEYGMLPGSSQTRIGRESARGPIKDSVAAVSIGIIDGKICLDLCYEEDSRADVDMNFVMTGSGKFIEVQGTAENSPFTKKQMERMAEIAQQGIKELLKAQKKVIAELA